MVTWDFAPKPVDYEAAVSAMETHVAAMLEGHAPEKVWLVEHPPLYTAGTSASPDELLSAPFPVHTTGRGGRYTYHGPGQRVGYVMVDLRVRGRDVRAYVHNLEAWIIAALAECEIQAERREGRIGLWVDDNGLEKKIAAIGVRMRRWVTYHGVSINVEPNLDHFSGIVPCGLADFGVTSIAALGKPARMAELDAALKYHFARIFPDIPNIIEPEKQKTA